jgi:pimeloyl-ACP methyl ester carboxylesterase
MKEAVILVPGIMGSVLQDDDEVIWPGSVHELLLPYSKMNQLLKPNLVATDVIRNFSISSQYDDLIQSLNTCGFTENGNTPTLAVYPYDWRKDNAYAAKGLAACIDNLVQKMGSDTEISLIAHSMGGLVSRYYLESDLYSARSGFSNVKCLITIGTPHRGSPMALAAALGQEKRLFLSEDQVRLLASNPNFPSLYQLLPPRGEPFAWDRSTDKRFLPIDIYDSTVSNKLGLITTNLNSATNFHSKLDLNKRPEHVRYFFFAGTRQITTNSVQILSLQQVRKVDREDAGDGTVPIWSGSQSGVQMEPVGGEHGELYKSGGLKKVLGVLLGKPEIMLAAGLVPEISVRHKVVTPDDTVQVTIDFPTSSLNVEGALNLRRLVDGNGIEDSLAKVFKSYPVSYIGPEIDHLSVLIEAPEYTGIYELSYVTVGNNVGVTTTELFVQGK